MVKLPEVTKLVSNKVISVALNVVAVLWYSHINATIDIHFISSIHAMVLFLRNITLWFTRLCPRSASCILFIPFPIPLVTCWWYSFHIFMHMANPCRTAITHMLITHGSNLESRSNKHLLLCWRFFCVMKRLSPQINVAESLK